MLIVSCLSLMISIASVSASSQLDYHIRSRRVLALSLISSAYAPLVIYSVAITELLQFGVQYIRLRLRPVASRTRDSSDWSS